MNLLLVLICTITQVDPAQPDPVFMQVLNDLKNQPVGPVTLAALRPSEEFLPRVAHRIVRMSFQTQRHQVENDDRTVLSGDSIPQSQPSSSTKTNDHTRRVVVPCVSGGLITMVIILVVRARRRKREQGQS